MHARARRSHTVRPATGNASNVGPPEVSARCCTCHLDSMQVTGQLTIDHRHALMMICTVVFRKMPIEDADRRRRRMDRLTYPRSSSRAHQLCWEIPRMLRASLDHRRGCHNPRCMLQDVCSPAVHATRVPALVAAARRHQVCDSSSRRCPSFVHAAPFPYV